MDRREFQELVWAKGRKLYRGMAWRADTRPYYVLVSELMLQQTQVARVEVKFTEFAARFPDIESLAHASLGEVLELWSGLGYNRRAKFLWQAAQQICDEHAGQFPQTIEGLARLPGVGVNTAGAIMVYAYNDPVVFVETNIRTVYLYHFFANRNDVADNEICELVAATLDVEHPREWYWALMDYGRWLKSQRLGHISGSKHYVKQAKLAGSLREMRGRILKTLTRETISEEVLRTAVQADDRYDSAITSLQTEGLIQRNGLGWRLPQ